MAGATGAGTTIRTRAHQAQASCRPCPSARPPIEAMGNSGSTPHVAGAFRCGRGSDQYRRSGGAGEVSPGPTAAEIDFGEQYQPDIVQRPDLRNLLTKVWYFMPVRT